MSKIEEMHDQLKALCKRMDEAEGILTTGYIYPKTLPADAVIVIRCETRLMMEEISLIRQDMEVIWPGHKCYVLHSGLSLEIIEGGKPDTPKNYSEARDEIKRHIRGGLIVTAGMPIRAGTAVYIADDGLAYAACGAVGFVLS